jgi:hypothetical protein
MSKLLMQTAQMNLLLTAGDKHETAGLWVNTGESLSKYWAGIKISRRRTAEPTEYIRIEAM